MTGAGSSSHALHESDGDRSGRRITESCTGRVEWSDVAWLLLPPHDCHLTGGHPSLAMCRVVSAANWPLVWSAFRSAALRWPAVALLFCVRPLRRSALQRKKKMVSEEKRRGEGEGQRVAATSLTHH